MKRLIKLMKFVPLLIVLSLISVGHRIFGDKDESKVTDFNPFKINSAKADVPPSDGSDFPVDGDSGGSDDS